MSQFWPLVPTDTGWVTVTGFENGWSNDPVWGPIQVRREGDHVEWRGQLVGGTTGAALTIPNGFLPEVTNVYWPAITAGGTSVTRLAVHAAAPTKLDAQAGSRPNLCVVRYRAI